MEMSPPPHAPRGARDASQTPVCTGASRSRKLRHAICSPHRARLSHHQQVHSAGHLLDVCMARIGLGPEKLVPAKGQHYADVAYVEYKARGRR